MDGFQFELCIRAAVDEPSKEYDLSSLASLDEYLKDEMLLDKKQNNIDPPTKLDVWFHDMPISDEAAAVGNAHDGDLVLLVVLQQGSDRWLSLGLKLGFTVSQVNNKTNGISLGSDKLKALFEGKAQVVGRGVAVKCLLAACRTIPQPIIGAVMNQLAVDRAAVAPQVMPISQELEVSMVANGKLCRSHLVAAARVIADRWKEFATHLAPDKFNASTMSILEQEERSLFNQAHRMLDDWINDLGESVKCSSIIETFLRLKMRAQANSIFARELVDYVDSRGQRKC